MVRKLKFGRCIVALGLATLGVASRTATADDLDRAFTFHIPSESLESSLLDLSSQANYQIVFSGGTLSAMMAPALSGRMTVRAALNLLLQGTQLKYKVSGARTLAVSAPMNIPPPFWPLAYSNAESSSVEGREQSTESLPANAPASESSPHRQPQETTLEEIIVTARKREESLLDVPVVATVLTRAALEQSATDDLSLLKNHVPDLLLGAAVGSSGTQISLRGIGTTAINATMDQSVSLNVDGLSLTQGLAYSVSLFDAAQVEVLRGPQALFFGKNNTAGVISLTSADPTDKLEIAARTGYEFVAGESTSDLIFSGPVSPWLKLRLAARYSDGDGYFKNEAQPLPGLGGADPQYGTHNKDIILRGTAIFDSTSWYTARLKVNYAKDELTGAAPAVQVDYCPDGTAGVPPVNIPFLRGAACSVSRNFYSSWMNPSAFPAGVGNGIPYLNIDQSFGTLDQTFRPSDDLSVDSVTGYYDSHSPILQSGGTDAATMPYAVPQVFDSHQFTEELRLTSDFKNSPLNFMAGGFYDAAGQKNAVRVLGNVLVGGLPATLQNATHRVDIHSTSLFGQLLWNIDPKLELAAGARWTKEHREHYEVNFNPTNGPLGPVNLPDPRISSTHVSPEVTLTYKPTSDFTAFAAYKTGFKSGSFNSISFVPPTLGSSFNDEEVRGGEGGVKFRTPDHRFSANLAAYYYHYTNLQVGAINQNGVPGAPGFTFATRTINAASANVKGIEFDTSYAPAEVDGLTVNGSVNYNYARYVSFPNAPCAGGQTAAQGCNQIFNPATKLFIAQNLAGLPLVRAPDWTSTLGLNYDMRLRDTLILAYGAGANYTSRYSTALIDLSGFYQNAFVKFDANIALRGKDDTWEIALIGLNLADKLTRAWCTNSNSQNGSVLGGQISGGTTSGPAGRDEAVCSVDRGREVWARLSWRL